MNILFVCTINRMRSSAVEAICSADTRERVSRAAGLRTVVMVFASPVIQFYHDRTTPAHLSGLSHLDNFIIT